VRHAAPLVAAATLAAWLPSLGGAFQFDDYNVIVNHPAVHSWQAFFEGVGGGVRAVLKASYVLNWTVSEGPVGFHAVNIALHAVNAVLLYLAGKTLFEKHAAAAFVAALLFALHPAQTEAVTYISGRTVSLMASFYLASLLLYLKGKYSIPSLLLFVLALATRETAVTLPAALLLCELARGTPLKAALRRGAPYWAIAAAGALVLLFVPRYTDFITFGYTKRSLADNLVTQIDGVSYLVSRLVGLHGYNIDPALPTLHALDGVLVFEAAMLLALFALGVLSFRERPWVGFGILWFFLQLAPTNSIVPRLDVVNDRQLYLAGWGLFLAVCVQFERIGFARTVVLVSGAVTALAFAITSILRQLDYRDEITLWEASVRAAPWNARGHNNLGYAYYLAERKAEARREMQTALRLDPRNEKARANLALLDWD
jgi:protein O-mannosyl-transferase